MTGGRIFMWERSRHVCRATASACLNWKP